MYEMPHFREDDLDAQHALIEAYPLGLLISPGPDGILANPIPFVLYRGDGERGTLRCHLAKANPQWQALEADPAALVVFQGSQSYVTPSWYPTKTETEKVVPTWNYAIVQARGPARVIHDPAWLHANVTALTDQQEGRRPNPWAVTDAPGLFIAAQLKGIVGVEIPIESITGKFKASQNRPLADRQGVAEGLTESNPDMAAMVRERGGI
ncbi:MAG TPA: FMN-binding negative transcriptional regulator [Devosia sp.]